MRRASPLRNGYLVQDRAFNLALRAYDAMLAAIHPREPAARVPAPRRLLVCIGGHLGDAVLATTALPVLRAGYPRATIGILAPSWSLPIFDNHPAVRWRHAFDHWKINRSSSPRARWIAYRRSLRRARAEIEAIGYDTAVDLYPYFPNAARILSECAVPIRIGYTSGGGGPLYSHAVAWADGGRHTAERHHDLLRAFLPHIPFTSPRYDLPPIGQEDVQRGRSLLRSLGVADHPYVVLHPGAGDPRKRWPAHEWRALARALGRHDPGLRIVLTGHGDADAAVIEEIRGHDATLLSACDRTNLGVLRYMLAHASLVIGVDSLAAHLAAAHDVPCIMIMAAMSDPAHWRPLGSSVAVLTSAVPCAPCFRSTGCATMSCVRGVTPEVVERAAIQVLQSTSALTS